MSEQLVYTLETSRFHEDGRVTCLAFVLPGGVVPPDAHMVFLEVGEDAWSVQDAVACAYGAIAQSELCVVHILKSFSEMYQREVLWPIFRGIGTSRIKPLWYPEGYLETMNPSNKLMVLEAFFTKLSLDFRTAHHPYVSDVEPPVSVPDRSEDREISGLPSD